MRLAVAAMTLFGCATPYQRMGFRGGVAESSLGVGRWMIRVETNSYTSRATAVEYSYRRAAELCPSGFDPVDSDRSSRDHYASFDGGKTVQNMPKSSAMLVVQCRMPTRRPIVAPGSLDDPRLLPQEHQPTWKPGERPDDAKPRARVENGVNVILVDHLFYCFEVKGTGVRMCASEVDRCRQVAHSMQSLATCEAAVGAACFRVKDVVSGGLIGWCFATMEWCQKGRPMFESQDTVLIDECLVMRYEP